jgi:ribosome-binding factor A
MSNRTIRVNELLRRELGDILRKHYQADAVAVTVTEVRVAPDLRDARVFIAIVGDADFIEKKMRWLRRQAAAIREELSKRIVLKYLPKIEYRLDEKTPKATQLLRLLDELGPVPDTEQAGDEEAGQEETAR